MFLKINNTHKSKPNDNFFFHWYVIFFSVACLPSIHICSSNINLLQGIRSRVVTLGRAQSNSAKATYHKLTKQQKG